MILALGEKMKEHHFTADSLSKYLHDYFHNNEPERSLSNEQMDRVLCIFKKRAQNNAHNFFSALFMATTYPSEVQINQEMLVHILSSFERETIQQMLTSTALIFPHTGNR